MRNSAFSFLFIVFISAGFSCKQPVKNNKIKNGIEIYEDGLHVEQAFLTNADSSTITDANKVEPGERVCLRMIIKGWKEDKGKIFMDASQTVTTSAGDTLATNPSIFGITLMYGVVPAGADHVLLYQTIGRLSKPADYIVVRFKVWDKATNKSVHGFYKLYL